ncbi:hypothetical protein [Streptosporangium sp. LJ11]|uniref:hypothetical protein n=1 Tax=Streptosporangium sp. LJ11 TaxID=3436927 RepID=UPI003F7AF93A
MTFLGSPPIAGHLVAENHQGRPDALREEFRDNSHNGHVGGRLLPVPDVVIENFYRPDKKHHLDL